MMVALSADLMVELTVDLRAAQSVACWVAQ